MRVTLDNFPWTGPTEITLDGNQCFHVQAYDVEHGYVEAPRIDDDGSPVFDLGLDEWPIIKHHGKVEVRLIDEPWKTKYTAEQRREMACASQFHISRNFGFV